jgi:hypothetical protein
VPLLLLLLLLLRLVRPLLLLLLRLPLLSLLLPLPLPLLRLLLLLTLTLLLPLPRQLRPTIPKRRARAGPHRSHAGASVGGARPPACCVEPLAIVCGGQRRV